jgi:hypothetical protein
MEKIFLAFVLLFLSHNSSFAKLLVWKTEKYLGDAKQLSGCDPKIDKNCSDEAPYVSESKFGTKVFQTYHEGTRMSFGFGSQPNELGQFAPDQQHPGGFDWGGTVVNGKFKPLYVIKRFYKYDWSSDAVQKDHTELVIFRLLSNGKSCFIDTKSKSTAENRVARQWVEKDFENPTCTQ